MLFVNAQIQIPRHELEFSYARSSGPGGQNVNKVNSKAVLRWCLATSTCLPLELKASLLNRLASRLTAQGELVVMSDRFRDQGRNREDCLEKLAELLRRAAHRETPRKKTRVSRAQKRKRRESKTAHSQKKADRRRSFGY